MAVHNTLGGLFTDIADAIREKSGGTGEIVADNFPDEIKNLATHEVEDALVSTGIVTYTNDRVTEIATNAFNSRNIREAHFANVTIIRQSAFYGCVTLGKVTCPKLQAVYGTAFVNAGSEHIRSLDITARKCGYVGSESFMSADIERFYMYPSYYVNGELLFKIEKDAFYESKLKSLVIASENGEMCELNHDQGVSSVFSGTPIASGKGYIYVPRTLVDSYKAANGWSTYASQFRALEDYTVDGTITGELDESKI